MGYLSNKDKRASCLLTRPQIIDIADFKFVVRFVAVVIVGDVDDFCSKASLESHVDLADDLKEQI